MRYFFNQLDVKGRLIGKKNKGLPIAFGNFNKI